MATQLLTAQIDDEEAARIETLAQDIGLEREALIGQLIRRGYEEVRFEHALSAYQRGRVSLSRAAEMAGVSVRELLLRLPEQTTELNYDLQELKRELSNG